MIVPRRTFNASVKTIVHESQLSVTLYLFSLAFRWVFVSFKPLSDGQASGEPPCLQGRKKCVTGLVCPDLWYVWFLAPAPQLNHPSTSINCCLTFFNGFGCVLSCICTSRCVFPCSTQYTVSGSLPAQSWPAQLRAPLIGQCGAIPTVSWPPCTTLHGPCWPSCQVFRSCDEFLIHMLCDCPVLSRPFPLSSSMKQLAVYDEVEVTSQDSCQQPGEALPIAEDLSKSPEVVKNGVPVHCHRSRRVHRVPWTVLRPVPLLLRRLSPLALLPWMGLTKFPCLPLSLTKNFVHVLAAWRRSLLLRVRSLLL